ncbi:uncharacterized protein RCC_06647 [Ramularia collo-cygni]|uniref:DUF7514 domain-containing protein n=1 Tax=Ramularia collo-cygni TaxID=112498 RepID=A0A2D3VG02_9PEZI|nr:uncharacterized protein RCC_06647 [Ramularia collo-cygni]CZT20789.1 uncharacterized protein RCC_06647 [Ramularia collo-cygni]
MAPSPTTPDSAPPLSPHSMSGDQREAYEYWGYLFNPDKTGTPRLKALLRGLKDIMNESYENSNNNTHETSRPAAPFEQPDLTPTQLAHFYRDLHGNYDQLFLATPNESLAFIYKSLGCLHSLQPLRHATHTGEMANGSRERSFTDPVVPALKTEGWIMWQTIQILLGPEEHAQFLREAVEKWDVRDPDSGHVFPKILPRECFPREPDRHMVAWYEGVSERLRKEAEAEEAARFERDDVDDEDDDEGRPRRLRGRREEAHVDEDGDDLESVDSRAPALAYFRNPLYRHVDGRPSIVRHRSGSKRPALSPRQSMMDKGKEAVGSLGRIARNVGSPYLWDGRGGSRSGSAHAQHVGGRRRRPSHAHASHDDGGAPPTSSGSERRESHSRAHQHQRKRTTSSHASPPQQQQHQPVRPGNGSSAVSSDATADDEWWEKSEVGSTPPPSKHHINSSSATAAAAAGGAGLAGAAAAATPSRHSRSQSQHHTPTPASRDEGGREGHHRRHRSAEPTPSAQAQTSQGREGEPADYFAGVAEAKRKNGQQQKQQKQQPQQQPQPQQQQQAGGEISRRSSGESSTSNGGGGGGGGGGVTGGGKGPTPPPVPASNGVPGVSFGPSAGPLFASTVARSGSLSAAGRGGGRAGGRGEDRRASLMGEERRGSVMSGRGGYPPPQPGQDPHRHVSQHRPNHASRRDEGRRGYGYGYDDPRHFHHADDVDPRRYDSPPRRSLGGPRFDDGGRRASRDLPPPGRRHALAEPEYDDDDDYDSYDDDGYEEDRHPARRSGEDFGGRKGGSREDVVGASRRRSGGRKMARFQGDDGEGGGEVVERGARGVSGRRYA